MRIRISKGKNSMITREFIQDIDVILDNHKKLEANGYTVQALTAAENDSYTKSQNEWIEFMENETDEEFEIRMRETDREYKDGIAGKTKEQLEEENEVDNEEGRSNYLFERDISRLLGYELPPAPPWMDTNYQTK